MRTSPAQAYGLAVGATLLAAGVLGFFHSNDFAVGGATLRPEHRAALLGVLAVNGWHNVLHVLTGTLALLAAGSARRARSFALALGALYAILGGVGFALGSPGSLLGLVPLNTADDVLHSALGALGLLAALASSRSAAPTTT